MTENSEIDASECIDKDLFDFIIETDPEVLKRFTPTVTEEEEKRFLNSDFSSNPVITYQSLEGSTEELINKRELLLSSGSFLIQAYIDSRGLNVKDREELLSYYWDFVKRRNELFELLLASSAGDFKKFDSIAEKLYGNPSIEIFNTYLRNIYEETEKGLENPLLYSYAKEVREVLPPKGENILEETEINLEPFRTYLLPKMKPVLDTLSGYDDADLLDSTVIKQTFERALESIYAKDWKIVPTDQYKAITVKGDKREVYIPLDKKVSKQKLYGLLAHEIYTHVQRKEASERIFPYEILRSGLNGYLEGEEAIATFSEAALDPKKELDLDGGDMHFATCLALGLDGHKRDFKEVFKVLYFVKKFNNVLKGKDIGKADIDAKSSAWKTTLRVFRGTPGNIPGVCFRKDLVYGEGRLQLIWYLKENKDKDISDLWKAKYSPWETAHLDILQRYQ